jgi:hypothetical protein
MLPMVPTIADHKAEVAKLETELAKTELHQIEAGRELSRIKAVLMRNPAAPGNLRYDQVALNRALKADGVRLDELRRDIASARRFLEHAEEQEKAKARVARFAATALMPKDKWYEIETPDHRVVRVRHSSRANLEADLLPGYTVRGVVFGADAEGKGGIDAMRMDLLVAALEARGFRPAKDIGAR